MNISVLQRMRCSNSLRALATNAAVARNREYPTMTALRDIIVVLDGSAASETRLALAIALAQQHKAHLTGLSALALLTPPRPAVHPRSYPETDMPPAFVLPDLGEIAAEKAEQIEVAFRERLRLSGVQADWRVVSDKISEAVAGQA